MAHTMPIMSARDYKEAARTPYAWPGGYPTYLLMADGGEVCMGCARKDARVILQSIHEAQHTEWPDEQWCPIAHEVYWEGPPMVCTGCNGEIESAYGDPDGEGN